MSAPTPPPAWPPTPSPYPSPPAYGGPGGTPFGAPQPPAWGAPGIPVRELLGRIREGIRWYLLVLLLSLLAAVVGAAVLGYVVGGLFAGGSVNAPTMSAATAGVTDALGLVGFLTLIFTIVSWVKWRSGIRPLPDSAAAYGPAYWNAAESAKKDYGRTVWSFLSIFIATIIFVIATVVYAVSQVLSHCPGLTANNTTCLSNTGVLVGGILGATLAFGLVVALLQFLMYFFSSRSLVDAVRPLSGPEEQKHLDRGRLAMVVGAALTPVGLVNAGLILYGHPFEPLAFVGILTPLLLLYGMYEIHGAYSRWLERPSLPPSLGPVGGQPYAPTPMGSYGPPVAQPYGAPSGPSAPSYGPPR